MKDIGVSCTKKSYGRGAGVPMACPPGLQDDAALCYTECRSGYYGVGPVCWESCPSLDKVDGGALCCRDKATCTKKILDLSTKLPWDIVKAILSGKTDWKSIIQDVEHAVDDILGFVMPLCSKLNATLAVATK